MATKKWAILLVIVSTLLTSSGQLFLKKGANQLSISLPSLITNFPLIIGAFIYIVAALLLIISLKNGELSVLYPLYATSFVWVSILSIHFLNEPSNPFKWAGVLAIISGVAFIGRGG